MKEKFMKYLPYSLISIGIIGIIAVMSFDTDTLQWILYRLLWLIGIVAVYAVTIIIGLVALRKAGVIQPGKVGLYFDVLTWEPTKIVLSGLIGFTIAALLGLFGILDAFSPFTGWMLVAVAVVMTYYVWRPDVDESGNPLPPLRVPETKKAAYMLPFGLSLGRYLGGMFATYLMTSQYASWNSKHFLRSKKPMEPLTDKDGFIEMGEVQFPVWDNREAEKGTPQRVKITAPSKNNVEITGQLLLVLEASNPILMLDSTNAAQDIGERARQEFRKLTESVVDTDLPKLQTSLSDLLKGERIVTFFVKRGAPGFKESSMIRNESGEVMFEWVEFDKEKRTKEAELKGLSKPEIKELLNDELKRAEEAAAVKLTERVFKVGDRKMVQHLAYVYESTETDVTKVGKGENIVIGWKYGVVTVENPIQELIEELGYKLKRVTFSDIEFAPKVKAAAEANAAEGDERLWQLASASTMKAVSKALLPDPEDAANPWYQQAQIIAAAQDDKSGNIKILLMPGNGSNNLTGAVVGANIVGGNKS